MTAPLATTYLVLSELRAREGRLDEAQQIAARRQPLDSHVPREVFRREADGALVELRALGSPGDVERVLHAPDYAERARELAPLLQGDFRHEVLRLREVVRPQDALLPSSPKLQLRHIEVPPYLLDEYHRWRETTIFAHVRRRADIDSFVAYHSLVSASPGILFVVGFSGSEEDLARGFATPEYKEIIRQADRFIVGGNANLYTKVYERVPLA